MIPFCFRSVLEATCFQVMDIFQVNIIYFLSYHSLYRFFTLSHVFSCIVLRIVIALFLILKAITNSEGSHFAIAYLQRQLEEDETELYAFFVVIIALSLLFYRNCKQNKAKKIKSDNFTRSNRDLENFIFRKHPNYFTFQGHQQYFRHLYASQVLLKETSSLSLYLLLSLSLSHSIYLSFFPLMRIYGRFSTITYCGIQSATLYYSGYAYVLEIYEVQYRNHLLIFIVIVYALNGCTQCSDKGQLLNCYSGI